MSLQKSLCRFPGRQLSTSVSQNYLKKMKKTVFFLVIILSFTNGCRRDETTPTPVFYIDNAYKSLIFKEQSYWIYKNNISNEIDSLVLTKADSGFYWNPPPIHGSSGTKREFNKMTIESKSFNYDYEDLIDSYGIRRNPETEWEICGRIYYSTKALDNLEFMDSLVINERVFFNIIKCHIVAADYVEGCSNSGFIFDTDLYTAPHFGVIRKVVYKDQIIETWDLVRWLVLK